MPCNRLLTITAVAEPPHSKLLQFFVWLSEAVDKEVYHMELQEEQEEMVSLLLMHNDNFIDSAFPSS